MSPYARVDRSCEPPEDVAPPRARRATARLKTIGIVAAVLCFTVAVLAGGQARAAIGIVAAVLVFAVVHVNMRPEDRGHFGAGGNFLGGGDGGVG
jgi:hypothetical protein